MDKYPKSCDTFVVLPPLTKNGKVVFGKNSDRPQHEVQEVIYVPGGHRGPKLKCTYITIDDFISPVNAIILSKPAWMWGAEIGANDKNVVIGNEAVWTNYNDDDGDSRQSRLLGMDLLRLGLERGNSAESALNLITYLLEKYGQGGDCSEFNDGLFYHNSFIIADPHEAWVLETSGKIWAAERITNGYRNISNGLTITTKIDKSCRFLREKAKNLGLWDGVSEFNFTKCFTAGGDQDRQAAGENLLKSLSEQSTFNVKDMFTVLRNKESKICRGCDDTFPTQGSQVSVLSEHGMNIHWFTATPDPSISLFKPFIFTPDVYPSPYTVSPKEPNREHQLYKLHLSKCVQGENTEILSQFAGFEEEMVDTTTYMIQQYEDGKVTLDTYDMMFHDSVEAEVRIYTNIF